MNMRRILMAAVAGPVLSMLAASAFAQGGAMQQLMDQVPPGTQVGSVSFNLLNLL